MVEWCHAIFMATFLIDDPAVPGTQCLCATNDHRTDGDTVCTSTGLACASSDIACVSSDIACASSDIACHAGAFQRNTDLCSTDYHHRGVDHLRRSGSRLGCK